MNSQEKMKQMHKSAFELVKLLQYLPRVELGKLLKLWPDCKEQGWTMGLAKEILDFGRQVDTLEEYMQARKDRMFGGKP